ncbi:hypothetical protein [Streptomyces sp. NBC_00122]|uniref:hypothetical protein n=1 Tax=Streptomyces sp. NBC_00122 TaxID=2903623 RepID=UPI0032437583
MGRPEAPVDHTVPALGELAQFLRDVRGGIPYSTLAERSQRGASPLKRAASGKTLPTWECVEGYLGACGISSGTPHHERARQLHSRAQEAWRRPSGSTAVPRPDLASSEADLSRALRDAYAAAGRPSLRVLSERAEGWNLSRSTAHRIVNGQAMPVDILQYLSFLQGCQVSRDRLPAWFAAWSRVRDVSPFAVFWLVQFHSSQFGPQYNEWARKQQVYPKPSWFDAAEAAIARRAANSPIDARRFVESLAA